VAPIGWGGGGCDGGSRTGREDELLPWSSCMAYASKMSTITALPAAVLEPLTAVLAPPPPPLPSAVSLPLRFEPLTAVPEPPTATAVLEPPTAALGPSAASFAPLAPAAVPATS